MVSNKILNTLRSTNRVILKNTLDTNQGGNGPDQFGNQYWSFTTLQAGIEYFSNLNDAEMVEYLRTSVKVNAKHGLCSEQEILSEPYVVGYNPKHDAMTDLTKRGYDSINKFGMLSVI